jgi:hypothetical protein
MPRWKASGGTLKEELIYHRRFRTRFEAQAAIQEYIESFTTECVAIRLSATSPRQSLPRIYSQKGDPLKVAVSTIDSTGQFLAAALVGTILANKRYWVKISYQSTIIAAKVIHAVQGIGAETQLG